MNPEKSAGATDDAEIRTTHVTAQGLRTRIREAGEPGAEEAVLFLHGGPGSANDWDHLLPRVGSLARAIAFDLPGFGQADKPKRWDYSSIGWASFVAEALDELGVKRTHLVLNDMAGGAGLGWGVAHPDAFASAVLINTGALIDYRWHVIGKLHRAPLVGRFAAWTGRLGLRTILRLYEPGLPKDVVDRWRREYRWGTRRAVLGFYWATPASGMGSLAPELRPLDRPALVIWGRDNRFVPVKQAERQRQSFPSAEVVVLEDSRHYSHLEHPERVDELVLPFLRRQLKLAAHADPTGSLSR
jgi:pimeloyl-ACP methyl ester carboxylesterase